MKIPDTQSYGYMVSFYRLKAIIAKALSVSVHFKLAGR